MSGYRLRPKVVEDLETIGDFIAADNPAVPAMAQPVIMSLATPNSSLTALTE